MCSKYGWDKRGEREHKWCTIFTGAGLDFLVHLHFSSVGSCQKRQKVDKVLSDSILSTRCSFCQ